MSRNFKSIVEFGPAAAATLLTRAFARYHVALPYTPTLFTDMARLDSVDLSLSRVMLWEDKPAAVALIARRGWTSRLASIAVPEVAINGHAHALLTHLLADAAGRGDRFMLVEVIEKNLPAVNLYERCGFRKLRRLVCYTGSGGDFSTAETPEEIDPREFGRLLQVHGPVDLPWQISGETLALVSPGHTAWRLGHAAVLISDSAAPVITIRGLLPDSDRGDRLVTLLKALMARFPDKEWSAQAIFPEEWSTVFDRLGLQRGSLSQWQMVAALSEPARSA